MSGVGRRRAPRTVSVLRPVPVCSDVGVPAILNAALANYFHRSGISSERVKFFLDFRYVVVAIDGLAVWLKTFCAESPLAIAHVS